MHNTKDIELLLTRLIGVHLIEPTAENANFIRATATDLAKNYNIPVKKTQRIPFKEAALAFLKNGTGFVNTLPKLINSL